MSEFSEANGRLTHTDSHHRGAVLLRELQAEPDDDRAREMLAYWWHLCDAFKESAAGLREQFLRVGFVSDSSDDIPAMPQIVYRGAWDDDELESALSWTLDRAVAEKFARGLVGARARFVYGIHRPDNTPTIFAATCVVALGWFTGRGEEEVIAGALLDVHPIAELVRAD